MDVFEKLRILSDAAKYDVACTSSGVDKQAARGGIGNAAASGICHTFSADGRCISLLKVLLTNVCVYDCKYCVNRRSNDTERARFSPRELADLTIQFYRRNYIEGLFLSSGVVKNPDYTCEQIIETLRLLREEYRFSGYIHAKAIPGADSVLLARLGMLADRMSVNIEMPSGESLALLAPDKSKDSILQPMRYIKERIGENTAELVKYRHAPKFVPAGQSTQMIVGATPETDYKILRLTQGLYRRTRCCPHWIQSRRFGASIVCIRRIGCCVFMALRQRSYSMRASKISIRTSIRNATGRCDIRSCFPWMSTAFRMKNFCACRASASRARKRSFWHAVPVDWISMDSKSSAWSSSGRSISSSAEASDAVRSICRARLFCRR